MSARLEVTGLSKSFRGLRALANVSFNVETGFRDVFFIGAGFDYLL